METALWRGYGMETSKVPSPTRKWRILRDLLACLTPSHRPFSLPRAHLFPTTLPDYQVLQWLPLASGPPSALSIHGSCGVLLDGALATLWGQIRVIRGAFALRSILGPLVAPT